MCRLGTISGAIFTPVNKNKCLRFNVLACAESNRLPLASNKLKQADTQETFIRKDNRYEFNSLSISGAIDWPSFDRWIDLRDEMNSLFELPMMGNLTRRRSSSADGRQPSICIRTTTM